MPSELEAADELLVQQLFRPCSSCSGGGRDRRRLTVALAIGLDALQDR